MDNKDKSNPDFLNDPIRWKSLGFFSAQEYLLYVFKKTEKITAALYLVSGLLKDDEPLKWELRERGIDFLASSFTASSSLPGDKSGIVQSLFSAALETISLLNVARISNLITEMNHTLLVREIDNVLTILRDRLAQSAENAGYVLSESFFRTPDLSSSGFKPDMKSGGSPIRQNDKGHSLHLHSNKTDGQPINKGQDESVEKKSQRRENIIGLLKGQSNLTIKDFSAVIKDCSEKTIQRDLLELVHSGIVKKEGERRWSRYSLK